MPRIVVRVTQNPHSLLWTAECEVDRCQWRSRPQVVKVAAQDEARYHREQHRAAVK
jgi:hypothetical protein